jgi:hypothetical protein
MTGNGTARGHVIPTFAPCTMAAASPPERIQIDDVALLKGATSAEKTEIMRGLIVRHPRGTVHALFRRAPGLCLVCAHTSTSLEGADGGASQF